jgi:hypothetical protein
MEVNTKFNVGDQVWLVESNKVVMGLINTLVINWEGDTVDIKYSTNGSNNIPEHLLFKTKNEVLESL